jgi:hypothetical protein
MWVDILRTFFTFYVLILSSPEKEYSYFSDEESKPRLNELPKITEKVSESGFHSFPANFQTHIYLLY